ncbi:hypothetical protein [Halonotius aquaticus]|uniref:hypothetical protein n=1 Tax=Halonotius aquaticus TaxID=2216978 RepID=UPI000E7333EE|nr:hypothetical protein [Halonotius aquaticus]
MSELPLASENATAEKHKQILENFLERYTAQGEPVNYKEAATGDISRAAASPVLKFWHNIGLLNKQKSGVYTPIDPVIKHYEQDFLSSGEAIDELTNILENYEIYSEAEFLIQNNEYEDNRKLAQDIVSIEDDLTEDDLGDIVRSIEAIKNINGFARLNDEYHNETNESNNSVNKEEENNSSTSIKQDSQQFEFDFEADDLPRYAGPDNLVSILSLMESGGTWTSDEIDEKDEVDMDKRNINGTLDYGVRLGFIEESDNEYIPTSEGFELYYNEGNDEKLSELLLEAVADFEAYVLVIEETFSKIGSFDGKDGLENKDIINVLRTEFGFTEVSNSTLKRSVKTLIETLDGMGYGTEESGTGRRTQLKFKNDINLRKIVEELSSVSPYSRIAEVNESEGDKKRDNADSKEDSQDIVKEEYKESEPERSPQQSNSKDLQSTQTARQPDERPNNNQYNKEENKKDISQIEQIESEQSRYNKNVDIDITVKLSEMDSAELEAKLELIDKYL